MISEIKWVICVFVHSEWNSLESTAFIAWNREIMKVHSLAEKICRGMVVCRTEEEVSVVNVVSESDVLVMFATWGGEDTARYISEGMKYYKVGRLQKESRGSNTNNRITVRKPQFRLTRFQIQNITQFLRRIFNETKVRVLFTARHTA